MNALPTIRQTVEFGLDTVPEDRTVEVSLRSLMFVHQTLGELVRFFHQPDHYQTLSDVHNFLGSVTDGGGYDVLADAYYSKIRSMLPPDIEAQLEDSAFDHPDNPAYFRHGA